MCTKIFIVVVAVAALNGCSSMDFGETFFDATWVAAEALEIKDCRDAYQLTVDRLRLENCETDAQY